MLTNVISSFRLRKGKVLKLISWKHSFKRLNEEYEIAKKKKQALDNLFETGRISQATRDSFDSDINTVIMEIEKQQKDLLTKMYGKAEELESQVKTLETLLANYEIQHVVGEIDEEFYQREINLLSTGLESAKRELDIIKEATNQLCPPVEETTIEPPLPTEENEVEVVQNEPVENVPTAPEEVEVTTEPCQQEPVIMMEDAVSEETVIENAYTTPEEVPQTVEETPAVMEAQPPEITEDMPQVIEDAPQETECECPPATEEVSQDLNETIETTEEYTETTEETQVTEYFSQETEEQPEIIQETLESMDETSEATEDNAEVEVTEDVPQYVEEIADQTEITEEIQQTAEEMPQIIENEPQLIEETLQTAEETTEEAHPLVAPKEAPQEISAEAVTEEDQSDEETAEADEAAETDEDSEYEEL
jgi:hypothetical protein